MEFAKKYSGYIAAGITAVAAVAAYLTDLLTTLNSILLLVNALVPALLQANAATPVAADKAE